MTSWTIGGLLTWTADYLKQHGAESPRLDAEVLLAHARNCQRIELYTCFDESADESLRDRFRELVRRRAGGTPVAYLVGHREFYSRDFQVTPDTLIPRPETEFVLVALLDEVRGRAESVPPADSQAVHAESGETDGERQADDPRSANAQEEFPASASSTENATPTPQQFPLRIGDIGTGSGILAICAAIELPNAQIVATDVSAGAVEVAQANARQHDVENRIEWHVGDLFGSVPVEPKFDIVLSNPPYIAESERPDLPRDVLNYEPHSALFAGEDGLDVIDRLLVASKPRLREDGRLIVEFSPAQRASLESLTRKHGLRVVRFVEDLSKRPRVLVARLP